MIFPRRALLGSLPFVGLTDLSAKAQSARVTFGTAMEGGGLAAYGAAFIDAIRSVDPTLEIRAVTTKGIFDNLSLLETGELDLAVVFGEVAHELFAGIGRPPTELRVVSVMFSLPGMFVVRAESRYRSISDLRGRPVVWNGRATGFAVQARYVMDGLGLDLEKDFEPIYTAKLSDGPPLVIEGRAAALWGAGRRWSGFVAVATSPRGARFVGPDADEIRRIRARHPFLAQFTIPAGLYPGQYDPITTVGSWSFVLARANLDEAIGYRLAAALHKVQGMSQVSRLLVDTTVQKTLDAIASPDMLQPGVARFCKKAGLLP